VKRSYSGKSLGFVVLLIIMFFIASTALAEKPPWAGGGKDKGNGSEKWESKGGPPDKGGHDGYDDNGHGKGKGKDKHKDKDKHKNKDKGKYEGKPHKHFSDDKVVIINNYYGGHYGKGKGCPPGLAKKHNGCMPPGQAKKWAIGRPLPAGVVYYDLPPALVAQLGPPPSRHKYVRVAQDVLLLAVGTGMVVDAIDNLNWEFSH